MPDEEEVIVEEEEVEDNETSEEAVEEEVEEEKPKEKKAKKDKKGKKPKSAPIEISNTINFKKRLRDNTDLKVSKRARKLYIKKIDDMTLANLKELEKIAKKDDRKTIQEEDVEALFS